jgi:hypothetical protein
MGEHIIPLEGEYERGEARGWEGKIYRQVCVEGQRKAAEYLAALDEALYEERPGDWRVVGFRERTVVTRFGEVRIRRRLYRDKRGKYHTMLDEYVGLKAHQAATPEMQAICSKMGSEMSFRTAAGVLVQWQAGLLSCSTCWRLLQRTGEAVVSGEAAAVEAVFGRGERVPEAGEREVERLYMEADGVYVRLQGQPQSHMEVRSAIAYEDWEPLSSAREGYRLRGKRVYCHANEQSPFWEGASIAWARRWDPSSVREVIIGGDGAGWIRAGREAFPGAIWQLDSFHLARACGRAFGAEMGRQLYEALRAGRTTEAQAWLQHAPLRKGKQALRESRWVNKIAQEGWGVDWRAQLGVDMEEGRGLGCMEGTQAHLLAARMKHKGRSWSPAGARHMAKVQELCANHELDGWCYRKTENDALQRHDTRRPRALRTDPTDWLQASVPALHGPAENAPWVQRLRRTIHHPHLPN